MYCKDHQDIVSEKSKSHNNIECINVVYIHVHRKRVWDDTPQTAKHNYSDAKIERSGYREVVTFYPTSFVQVSVGYICNLKVTYGYLQSKSVYLENTGSCAGFSEPENL